MLWFTHPPRTGGSSAWSVLERKAKRMGWRAHDSIDMDSPGPHRNDTWSWKHSKAWDALLDDLDVAAPTLILHHRQGMPGLSNLQLRTFLSRTKASLEAKGCSLLLATLMRAPLSRALSEAGTHNFVDEEEVRAYSLVSHDVQTRFLVSQQPKPKAFCDPEHLATSRYRQAHHRLMPTWCYHREAAPLAQATANLALYDLVGSRDELAAFLAATSAALGWPVSVGRVPLLAETQIRRGVSDGDALAVGEANQADTRLFTGMCAPAGPRACDAVRGLRSGARTAAWAALARERPYDKVIFWSTPSPMNAAVCALLEEYAEASGRSFTDADGQDAEVVCATHNVVSSSGLPVLAPPDKRTLQLVLLRTPLEQAVSEFYWYTALEQPKLGCRDYAQGLANGTASGAPCRLSVVPTEAEVAKWAKRFVKAALPMAPKQVLAALASEHPPFVLLHKQLAESVRKLGVRLGYRFAAAPKGRPLSQIGRAHV